MPISNPSTRSTTTVARCPICDVRAVAAQWVAPVMYYGCPVCDTLFQAPMPTIEQMRAYVDDQYASGVYHDYVAAGKLKALTFARRAARLAGRGNGGRLLDVGASCGYFVEAALNAGFDAYGVELSAEAIAQAPPSVGGRLTLGDVNAIDAAAGARFDVITAFDIIEHVFAPLAFLHDIRRVAKPGSLIAITTPDAGHVLRYMLRGRWPMFQPMQHTVLFSRRSLRLALSTAGYDDITLGPATKTLTADYLAGQVDMYVPALVKVYRAAARVIPERLRAFPLDINIGEIMAIARVPTL